MKELTVCCFPVCTATLKFYHGQSVCCMPIASPDTSVSVVHQHLVGSPTWSKRLEEGFKGAWSLQRWRGASRGLEGAWRGLDFEKAWRGLDTQWTASVDTLHMPKPNVTRVQSATQWTASVHTLHMPKPNVTHVQVLRNGLPRYILYTCPNLM